MSRKKSEQSYEEHDPFDDFDDATETDEAVEDSAEVAEEPEAAETPAAKPQPKKPRRQVELDPRKLTKKQKEQLKVWEGPSRASQLDSFLQSQVEASRKRAGGSGVYSSTETNNLVIGVPCPALAFEYVITQDVFPLGLIIHLAGMPGSCKSALLYEMFRWIRRAGGGSVLLENETKFSPDLLSSIMQTRSDEMGAIIERCESLEDWQERLTDWIVRLHKDLPGTKENPGPGRTIPFIFGVDSIMGKLSMETQEKIRKEGSAGRSFPVEAMSINNYMKTVPQMIEGWPFTIVLNNHLKMGKDDTGRDVRRTAGGASVSFQESWELETKVRKQKVTSKDWDGIVIQIRCYKNSFGPTHRRIDTRLLWCEEYNEQTDAYEQVSWWDWDWSTVKLLTELEGRYKDRVKNEAEFHIDAPKKSDVANLAWSKTLGMSKSDAVSWSELGKMIRENEDVMNRLRSALAIKPRPLLAGDYAEQVDSLKGEIE